MNTRLVGLSLAVLSSSLGTSTMNVALPTLAQAFGASFHAVEWVLIIFLLGITACILPFGRLGDLLGRRRALRVALSFYGGASLLGALAPTLSIVIVARLLQGFGAAGMMALGVALVAEVVPKARTGSAMGLLGMTSSLGTALGPSLGAGVVALLGWRAIFLSHLAFAGITLVLLRDLPPDRDTKPATFDPWGALLLALSLSAYVLALALGQARFSLVNLALLVLSGVGMVLFVRAEHTTPAPLLRLELLDRTRGTSLLATSLVSCVVMTSMVVGPFYLSLGVGLELSLVGLTMSIGSAVAALTSFPAGRVVSGALNLARNLGLVTGACLMGATFTLGAGTRDLSTAPPSAVAHGMCVAYELAAALISVAFILVASSTQKEQRA